MASAGRCVKAILILCALISVQAVPSTAGVGLNPIIICMLITCSQTCKGNPWCEVPCMNSCRHLPTPPALAQEQARTPYFSCFDGCVTSECLKTDNQNADVVNLLRGVRALKGKLDGCVKGCHRECNSKIY